MSELLKKNSSSVSRRDLLKGAVASAAAVGVTSSLASSYKVVAQPQSELIFGSSYYKFQLGKFEIYSIGDGTLSIAPELFGTNTSAAFIENLLELYSLPSDELLAPMNTTLINTGNELILFDTGISALIPTGGAIPHTLSQLGISTNDIDSVVYTHAHPDHVGGNLNADGSLMYPNAKFYMSRTEWEFWHGLPEDTGDAGFNNTRDFILSKIDPLDTNLELFSGDVEIIPGITAMNSPGHTPGHSGFLIESDDQHLLITGDAANHHVISLRNPGWHLAFDVDPVLAVESRIATFGWAAEHQVKVLGYHFPFPGLGYVLSSSAFSDRWDWIPSM